MLLGEWLLSQKLLRLAAATILPGWLLLWAWVALLSTSADSVGFQSCSARAASSFGSHRRDIHR